MNGYLRLAHLGSLRQVVVLLFAIGATFAIGGCAGTATPTPIRYADLGHSGAFDFHVPFVVEFQAGDQLPVDFEFASEDFELSPAHPTMTLIAKQRCYVRFSADGVRASLDPKNFEQKAKTRGSFRFGLKVLRGEPAKLDVGIATPKR